MPRNQTKPNQKEMYNKSIKNNSDHLFLLTKENKVKKKRKEKKKQINNYAKIE